MADRTAIAWTDASWNPISGCSRISPGCDHCYAAALSARFGWTAAPWDAAHAAAVRLHPDRLDQPRHWRRPRRVFMASMGDLFHPRVPDRFLEAVLHVVRQTPQHTYQILTKRPHRMTAFFRRHPVPPNVWLGVTVEDPARAALRLPVLVTLPAPVRWISAEPLLAPLDVRPWLSALQWVVVGGESGPHARPMDPAWVRALRDQCATAGVPFFLKQWGGLRPGGPALLDGRPYRAWPTTPKTLDA